jgi:hypothetical protein
MDVSGDLEAAMSAEHRLRCLGVGTMVFGMSLLAGTALPVVTAGPASAVGVTTFVANYAGWDPHDAVPGDGVCADTLGRCSLRAAIEEARSVQGPVEIDLIVGVYSMHRNGPLVIEPGQDISIVNRTSSPAPVTLDRSDLSDRVFEIRAGASLTLDGLVVRGGGSFWGYWGAPSIPHGGGIFNEGTLVMRNGGFTRNWADSGGALSNDVGARATLVNVMFFGDNNWWVTPTGDGDQIENNGTMSLVHVTVQARPGSLKAGIVNNGSLVAENSLFLGNIAQNQEGPNCRGDQIKARYTISEDMSCGFGPAWDGLNKVWPLSPRSPAVDHASSITTGGRDWAGNPRPVDGNCDGIAAADIGADEYQPANPC